MDTLSVSESVFAGIVRNEKYVDLSDENASIIVSATDDESLTSEPGWAVVACNGRKFYRFVVYTVCSDYENTVILTNTNLYNLNVCSSASTKPSLDSKLILCDRFRQFSPKYAHTAKVALIQPYVDVENSAIDLCLKNYFNTSRYLHTADIICIDVSIYSPELLYSKWNLSYLYFKIDSIEGPPFEDSDATCGYLINTEFTSLHLVSPTSCFVPSVHIDSCNTSICLDTLSKSLYNVLPDGLGEVGSELQKIIAPFLLLEPNRLKLSPVFLLSGKSGTGKSTLISALAKQNGLRYYHENCVLLQNSQPAQTESAISNILSKVKNSSPCILYLRNIEALCEDESGNSDDRTVDHFVKGIKSLRSEYPVIVFCSTSNETKLSSALQRIFLQVVRITGLTYESRLSLLHWILRKSCLSCSNLEEIARSTANFVFADLIQLVSRAIIIHFQKSTTDAEIFVKDAVFELKYGDFVDAIDEMNASYADSIGAPEIPNVTWDDVGGLTDLKEEILSSLFTPLSSQGLSRSGLLLHGPPGTGKTLLAKAIATECKYNFLSVKGPELLNMYVGQSEKNVREVFARARESAPCIVFFDELDSLAPKRGQSGGSGSVMDRVVSQLLAEMDGIQKSTGVFILAATNRPDLIDSALLRPGRLDKMLFVGRCDDNESKINILKALTRKFKLAADVDFSKLVELLPLRSVTGADLYGVCSNAWLNAARQLIKSTDSETDSDGVSQEEPSVIVTMEHLCVAVKQLQAEDTGVN